MRRGQGGLGVRDGAGEGLGGTRRAGWQRDEQGE